MVAAVNSGLPSVAYSLGMPNVTNVHRRQLISPGVPIYHNEIIANTFLDLTYNYCLGFFEELVECVIPVEWCSGFE